MNTTIYLQTSQAMDKKSIIASKKAIVNNNENENKTEVLSCDEVYKLPYDILQREVIFTNGLTLLCDESNKQVTKFNPNHLDRNPVEKITDNKGMLTICNPGEISIQKTSLTEKCVDFMTEDIKDDGSIFINISNSRGNYAALIWDNANGKMKTKVALQKHGNSTFQKGKIEITEDGEYNIYSLSGGIFHREKKYVDTIKPFVSRNDLSFENGLR